MDVCSCNAVLMLRTVAVKAKNGTYKSNGRLPHVFRQRFLNNVIAFSYASVDTHAAAVNAGITLSELRCGNG